MGKKEMSHRGFTLFEVLVTLGILAVTFSLLFLTFHQSMNVMASAEEEAQATLEGRLILERMTGEFRNAFFSPRGGSGQGFQWGLIGRSNPLGREEFSDRVDFTTLVLPTYLAEANQGEVIEVGYFLDREPGRKGFTLYRREDSAWDRDLLRGGKVLSLCDRVRSLRFIYYDRQGRSETEWNSLEGHRRNQMPMRIEIQLKIEDAAGRTHLFRTQVVLPFGGGAAG